jgi:hypothetical protein
MACGTGLVLPSCRENPISFYPPGVSPYSLTAIFGTAVSGAEETFHRSKISSGIQNQNRIG